MTGPEVDFLEIRFRNDYSASLIRKKENRSQLWQVFLWREGGIFGLHSVYNYACNGNHQYVAVGRGEGVRAHLNSLCHIAHELTHFI